MGYAWSPQRRTVLQIAALLCVVVLALSSAQPAQAQQHARPPVNVAGAILFVQCPELVEVTTEVRFAYVQLDGNAAVRQATAENRGLIVAGNVPAVQITRLSFDFTQDSLYRFILTDESKVDIVVEPQNWSADRRNGILYTSLSC